MNSTNAHLYLPLVQALADGKTIQFNQNEAGDWADIDNIYHFNERPDLYRIKPEARVVYICMDGNEITRDVYYNNPKGFACTKFIEVLDED